MSLPSYQRIKYTSTARACGRLVHLPYDFVIVVHSDPFCYFALVSTSCTYLQDLVSISVRFISLSLYLLIALSPHSASAKPRLRIELEWACKDAPTSKKQQDADITYIQLPSQAHTLDERSLHNSMGFQELSLWECLPVSRQAQEDWYVCIVQILEWKHQRLY
jgi:hypothetical protein